MGACNVATDIKECCFLGDSGELVAAGSDDGRVFIHTAATGECIRCGAAASGRVRARGRASLLLRFSPPPLHRYFIHAAPAATLAFVARCARRALQAMDAGYGWLPHLPLLATSGIEHTVKVGG